MKRSLYYLFFSCLLEDLCHSCLKSTPRNVTFNTTNFEYVLQWNTEHLPSDVLFSVQYKRYGQTGWSVLHECQNITQAYCDLTNAITGDVEDFMEHQYLGKVKASSKNCSSGWATSNRLNPRDDTFLILPQINYTEHVTSVTIFVATPSLALRSKNNKSMTVEELYRDQGFEYRLSIFNTEKREKWQKPQQDNRFEVSGLSPNTEYNGSVHIMIGDKRKSDIQNFVVKTLPDHSMVTLIVSLIAIFAAILGIAIIYLSCKYVQRQAKTPSSLDFKRVTRIQIMTTRNEKYSSCTTGFFPSVFPPTNYPSPAQWDQSENSPAKSYISQFQPSVLNKDSPLLSQASFNLQQRNRIIDSSVSYALLEYSNIECESNHTPNILITTSNNSQLELPNTCHHQLLDTNDGNLNWLENKGGAFTLISPHNWKPSNVLEFMSTVVVSDASEFTGQEEHTETHPPFSLSDVILPGLQNNPEEKNLMENSLEHYRSQYRFQNPVDHPQLSFTNGVFISEQPYRLQH